jgi:hypothetical protein
MKYTIIQTPSGEEVIQGVRKDGSFIQFFPDPANSDYQAYLKSLDEASTL